MWSSAPPSGSGRPTAPPRWRISTDSSGVPLPRSARLAREVDRLVGEAVEQQAVAGAGHRLGRVVVHRRQPGRGDRGEGVHLGPQLAQRRQQIASRRLVAQERRLDDDERAPADRLGDPGNGGTLRSRPSEVISSGRSAVQSRHAGGSRPPAPAARTGRPRRARSTGTSSISSFVTTPKLPPPPRIAQNRSGSLSGPAVTSLPSAVTTSAPAIELQASPCLRTSQPTPPPSE